MINNEPSPIRIDMKQVWVGFVFEEILMTNLILLTNLMDDSRVKSVNRSLEHIFKHKVTEEKKVVVGGLIRYLTTSF